MHSLNGPLQTEELRDANKACLGTAGFSSDVNRINKWCGPLTGCFGSCFFISQHFLHFPQFSMMVPCRSGPHGALNELVLLKKSLKQIYLLGVVS